MKHEPKILVEQHYHIQELIDAQEKRANDRTLYRDRAKELEERNGLIKDAKLVEMKEFWCDKCKEDFVGLSVKQVEADWSNAYQSIAFYRGKHRACGTWSIRLITDRHKDGYWIRSKKVKADQGKHFAETIQPHQTGFNLLYKKI